MFHVKHPEQEKIRHYQSLVGRYQKTLDLISDKAFANFENHVSDALEFAEAIRRLEPLPHRVLDLGSGVGLPGIVLGIALPEVETVLVDRRRRRGAFLELARAQLQLANTTVRIEDVSTVRDVTFPVISAMAFGSLSRIYQATAHVHEPKITILTRKPGRGREEIAELGRKLGLEPSVLEEVNLQERGSLIVVELPGGLPCRS